MNKNYKEKINILLQEQKNESVKLMKLTEKSNFLKKIKYKAYKLLEMGSEFTKYLT